MLHFTCANPLGELKRSPDPLAAIRGPNSKGRGEGTGGTEGRGEEGGDGRGGYANAPLPN